MPPLSRKVVPAPPPELEWVPATVGLVTNEGRVQPADAWVLGVLAVHQTLAPLRGWGVTAVPSGRLLAYFTEPLVAKQFAEVLAEMRVSGLGLSDPREAASAVPQRVKNWARACVRHDRVVEPTPVMEGV